MQHIISQVPAIVNCAQAFVDILDKHASANRVFRMEEEVRETLCASLEVNGESMRCAICNAQPRHCSQDSYEVLKPGKDGRTKH